MAEEIQFEQVLYIKSPFEKVWEAIISPEIVTRYYMCPALEIGSQQGEAINYGAGGQVLVAGEILEFVPNQKLVHTFKFVGSHDKEEGNEASLVSYELIAEDGLTILVLTHSGFNEKNDTYQSATGGWPFVLSNLKTLLETGKTLRE